MPKKKKYDTTKLGDLLLGKFEGKEFTADEARSLLNIPLQRVYLVTKNLCKKRKLKRIRVLRDPRNKVSYFLYKDVKSGPFSAAPKLWTREKIINHLRESKDRLGRTPRIEDFDSIFLKHCRKSFGGFSAAKKEAGLRYGQQLKHESYSKRKVIKSLKELEKKLGRSPNSIDCRFLIDCSFLNYCNRFFGSFNAAKEAAGLKVYKRRTNR